MGFSIRGTAADRVMTAPEARAISEDMGKYRNDAKSAELIDVMTTPGMQFGRTPEEAAIVFPLLAGALSLPTVSERRMNGAKNGAVIGGLVGGGIGVQYGLSGGFFATMVGGPFAGAVYTGAHVAAGAVVGGGLGAGIGYLTAWATE